jgi:hypothetical protein
MDVGKELNCLELSCLFYGDCNIGGPLLLFFLIRRNCGALRTRGPWGAVWKDPTRLHGLIVIGQSASIIHCHPDDHISLITVIILENGFTSLNLLYFLLFPNFIGHDLTSKAKQNLAGARTFSVS